MTAAMQAEQHAYDERQKFYEQVKLLCLEHKVRHRLPATSRRRDCHFADTPSPSLSKRLIKGEEGQQNDSLADGYPPLPPPRPFVPTSALGTHLVGFSVLRRLRLALRSNGVTA